MYYEQQKYNLRGTIELFRGKVLFVQTRVFTESNVRLSMRCFIEEPCYLIMFPIYHRKYVTKMNKEGNAYCIIRRPSAPC